MDMDTNEGKSFWEKPQGTPGMVGLALLGVGAGYLLLKNAAFLALAMQNLAVAVFTGIGLFALVWVLKDKQVRNLIWYMYKGMVEKITNVFIDIYPIEIIKAYVGELKNKRRKMDEQLTKLKNEIGKIARNISDTDKEISQSMKMASAAKGKGKGDERARAQMLKYNRMAGRRANSKFKLSDLHKRMVKLYEQMDKMYFYSGIMIEDTSDQVKQLEIERNAIYASYSVMKSAQAILSGGSDEADMFERTMERVADDIGGKLGEMDRFMDLSQDFIDGVDLENGVFEMDGLAMLDEWEKGDSMKFLNEGQPDYITLLDSNEAEPVVLSKIVNSPQNTNKTNFFN